MYKVYSYDSYFESFEDSGSFETFAEALDYVNKFITCTTDTCYTSAQITWFEDGIECEIYFHLEQLETGKKWVRYDCF